MSTDIGAPYIRIFKYQGTSGAYGRTIETRWSAQIVSNTGTISLDSWMSEGYGYSRKEYALKAAEIFIEVLQLPVRFEEAVTLTSQTTTFRPLEEHS